jgi:hypothetical protein
MPRPYQQSTLNYAKTRKRAKSLETLQNLIEITRHEYPSTVKVTTQDNEYAIWWLTGSVEAHSNTGEVKPVHDTIPYRVNGMLKRLERYADIDMDASYLSPDVP